MQTTWKMQAAERINAMIAETGVSKRALAEKADISYGTLMSATNPKRAFQYDWPELVRKIVPACRTIARTLEQRADQLETSLADAPESR